MEEKKPVISFCDPAMPAVCSAASLEVWAAMDGLPCNREMITDVLQRVRNSFGDAGRKEGAACATDAVSISAIYEAAKDAGPGLWMITDDFAGDVMALVDRAALKKDDAEARKKLGDVECFLLRLAAQLADANGAGTGFVDPDEGGRW